MEDRKFGAFSSSVDPQKLGQTVKGIIISLSAIIVLIASQFGIALLPADVSVLATNVGNVVTLAALAYGALNTLYGALQKFVVHLAKFTK